jgi:hypothetical protein
MLSETRQMLKPYSSIVLEVMDNNQVASSVGATAEHILIDYFGWKKNGDIGNESGFDAFTKSGELVEIKSMSYETKTHYLAYKHDAKKDKYDYLAILHFNERRASIIPKKQINDFISKNIKPGRKSKTLRLCFTDPILTLAGKPRQKSLFLSLFKKYEVDISYK